MTPPLHPEELKKRFEVNRELEMLQERHINKKIQEYFWPFKIFLGVIGRFPWSIDENPKGREIIKAIKKTSCAPIMEMGIGQDQDMEEKELGSKTPYALE